MQNNYDAAIEYARAGLRVVPCKPQSKEPLINDWPKRGTTDRSQIREWFAEHPERNVGILTGGGVFAVDVDEEQGVKSLGSFVAGRSWPHTAMAETGNNGFHFLFRTDVRIPTKTGFRPGLDLRGESAKIVAAPSLHPDTGSPYRWISGPLDGIAVAPRWLKNWIVGETTTRATPGSPLLLDHTGDVDALVWDVVERFPVERPGTRHAVLLKVLCSLLGRGYDEGTTQEVGILWWEHYHAVGLIRTHPREAAREISAMIKSTLRSGTLRRAVGADHQAETAKINLTDAQLSALSPSPAQDSFHTGLTPHIQSDLDRWFVEALIVHFSYELSRDPARPSLPATNRQIHDLVKGRHERSLKDPEIERLKRRFVTRPGKPAARIELCVQTHTGNSYKKQPSEFVLTGLREILVADFPSSPQPPRPIDQPQDLPAQDSFHTGLTPLGDALSFAAPTAPGVVL